MQKIIKGTTKISGFIIVGSLYRVVKEDFAQIPGAGGGGVKQLFWVKESQGGRVAQLV